MMPSLLTDDFRMLKALFLEIALSKPAVALLETAPSAGLHSARSVCDAFTCWIHKPVGRVESL